MIVTLTMIEYDKGSFTIANILPDGFLPGQECAIEYTIGSSSVADPFVKGFSMLLEDQHISLMHSYYFGSGVAQEINLNKHPVQMAIFKGLESSGIERGKFKETALKSFEMENALEHAKNPLWLDEQFTGYPYYEYIWRLTEKPNTEAISRKKQKNGQTV